MGMGITRVRVPPLRIEAEPIKPAHRSYGPVRKRGKGKVQKWKKGEG